MEDHPANRPRTATVDGKEDDAAVFEEEDRRMTPCAAGSGIGLPQDVKHQTQIHYDVEKAR